MGRMPVRGRIASLSPRGCPQREPWGIIRRFHRLSPGRGLVAYALRTRAPLSSPEGPLPSDLHVLGLPLAFILSQDQTLHCIIVLLKLFPEITGLAVCSSVSSSLPAARLAAAAQTFFLLAFKLSKNSPIFILSFASFLRDWDCKSTAFLIHGKKKMYYF